MVYELVISDEWRELEEKELGGRPVLYGDVSAVRKGEDAFTQGVIKHIMAAAPVEGADQVDISTIEIPVDGGKHKNRALLYKPKDLKEGERRPVLVYFHGGGWSIGAPEAAHISILRLIAKTGCICVNTSYRLAPENPFPVPWQDCYDAYRWTIDNTDSLQTDNSKLFLGGNSAGGNMSAGIMAYEIANKRAKDIAGLILHVPCTVLPQGQKHQVPSFELAETAPIMLVSMIYIFCGFYLGGNRDAAFDIRVSPGLATDDILAQYPPTFISVAGADPLHDDGTQFAEKLRKNGVEVTLKDYPGVPHNWDSYASLKTSAQVHGDWGDYFNKVCASKK